MKQLRIEIDSRELATLLVALREWQTVLSESWGPAALLEYADHFEGTTPLTSEEVDALCEKLNFAESVV